MLHLDFIIRLSCALGVGAAIGLERQWRQRMAGLRTNALVSVGAALFVMLSGLMGTDASPTRIAAQVVSGIGFLGAGVIMRDGLNVRGLNTAATLWCAGAVGTLCGAGLLLEAALGAGAVLCANILLRPVALRINRNPFGSAEEPVNYTITAVCLSESEQHIRALLLQMLGNSSLILKSLLSEDLSDPRKLEVRAELACASRCDTTLEQAVSRLSLEGDVSAVSWKVVLPE
jgi:putative Mg2+ transporter-C (MgtC) family protein